MGECGSLTVTKEGDGHVLSTYLTGNGSQHDRNGLNGIVCNGRVTDALKRLRLCQNWRQKHAGTELELPPMHLTRAGHIPIKK